MIFDPPLQPATLLRRYKRFLADVTLDDGSVTTAHCANPGAMLGVDTPGSRIWLQPSTNPKRKLAWSWMLIELEHGLAGIDTGLPNRLTEEALAEVHIPELAAYGERRQEVKYGAASRVDFLLRQDGLPDCYLEVKNVHLRRTDRLAEFPDCVTKRGAKHMDELSQMVAQGHRAIVLFVIQRNDCDAMALACDLDPAYAAAAARAQAAGVEFLAYRTQLSPEGITLAARCPLNLQP